MYDLLGPITVPTLSHVFEKSILWHTLYEKTHVPAENRKDIKNHHKVENLSPDLIPCRNIGCKSDERAWTSLMKGVGTIIAPRS